ncbi:uroporphyrinogen-III C-methyltransferase [Limnobaculum zhutongyuii]|uniref:Siroheme synthase n=1 Tax=Limnobaculum zhutongyuii TaxID=2498113 RepID=A0A411WL92_9GAMM|nr:siroheme synthase CysG [Limnobaculum zhutongyuii]QBH96926.1 uroporphyrinogen-III C-methyltransferase [Limnobaculum zhutongyuii]TQS87031.1 uroporphyrinogen-III C-methyltransferase [Limnobaculum zhutongyuii]
MDYLPLFADLKHRPVLVVGGGEIAARKIGLLLSAGADVFVVAKALGAEVNKLHQEKALHWLAQEFDTHQLDDIFLVVAATNDSTLNARVFQAANQRRRLINVVDDPARCSFIFPSIIDRSPLVVAISSGGKAPVLARLLREKLEALLPASLGQVADIAGNWRTKVKQQLHSLSERRHFWERLFDGRFASLIAANRAEEAEAELEQQLYHPASTVGEVMLVGAGPGDPGLLTLNALRAIQQADVVLHDALVTPEILELVRRDATLISVGKRAGAHSVQQEETNQLLVELAQQGKRVVRLKGGDPFIFGRGGEELEVLVNAGIPYQVVPGITAAAGAAAYAGIPLTHRDHAQSITFITGHCKPESDGLNWSQLAQGHQTLAIYMGTVKASDIQQQLINHGRAASTPVAVISRGTRSDQKVLSGTLSQLHELAREAPTPALLVIGEVAALHQRLNWFGESDQSPLTSQNSPAQWQSVVNLA